jgi:membrane protein YdbS with pleckstrin-like domain
MKKILNIRVIIADIITILVLILGIIITIWMFMNNATILSKVAIIFATIYLMIFIETVFGSFKRKNRYWKKIRVTKFNTKYKRINTYCGAYKVKRKIIK